MADKDVSETNTIKLSHINAEEGTPIKFKVYKSVHHHTFQINQPTRSNNFSSLLLDVYVQLNICNGSL
jgi:hypothetical protein